MANNLTGDYEAVVQVAVRDINGLLASLHQEGARDDAPLKLLHSVSMRIGDPRRPRPDVVGFGEWVLELQRARGPRAVPDVRAQLTANAPPGAARLLADHFNLFDQVLEIPPAVVRGRVRLQISTIRAAVTDGSASELTLIADVRAHYYPDADTDSLPAPIHGEVRAGFDVRLVTSAGRRQLVVKPSPVDSKIQFIPAPGSGTDPVEASRLSAEIRKAVRQDFTLLPVDLPAGFPFSEFKGMGGGATQIVALPISLSGNPIPANRLQTITQQFIGPNGFGFGVSKEHILSLIDLEAIKENIKARTIKVTISFGPFGSTSVTYKLRFSDGPKLKFKTGAIEISGTVAAETGTTVAPNIDISFKQDITLELDPATQRVTLEAVGEPDVNAEFPVSDGSAANVVSREINKALAANNTTVRRVFADARASLIRGLKTFDTSASASYTQVQITPDGIIARGQMEGSGRAAPVVLIDETDQRQSFTALRSWIPGGTITRLIWSWVEFQGPAVSIFNGAVKTHIDEHRFIFPKPPGITNASQICLRIEGTRTLTNGNAVPIAGGTTCHLPDVVSVMDVPSWWEPVHVPVWAGNVAAAGLVKDAVVAHVSVQADRPGPDELTTNSLVYFADWKSEAPLAVIAAALKQVKRKSMTLVVNVVVPPGAFDARRREVDAKLASFGDQRSVRLQLTEDDEGGWTRTFGHAKAPAIYLINARREFVWKYEGEPDPQVLAEALDAHIVPAPGLGFRPVTLAVATGDRAPDAQFTDLDGNELALHRMRGRPMLITFWQSWSAPSLKELERLQAQCMHQNGDAPFVVAFHGGNDVKALAEIRKRYGLTFTIAQDVEQQIARRYGVRCWPTTVSVNAEGDIEHIQLGIAHGHHPEPGRTTPDTTA